MMEDGSVAQARMSRGRLWLTEREESLRCMMRCAVFRVLRMRAGRGARPGEGNPGCRGREREKNLGCRFRCR